jgi:uncharacterized membrane protein YhhN
MTTAAFILLAVAAGAAMIDWWAVLGDRLGLEFLAKPLVIIALVGVALAVETDDNVVRGIVIAALGASLVADVVLMTPDARFEAGLFASLVAHLLYIAALVRDFQIEAALVGAVVVVGVAFGVVPELMEAVRAKGRLITRAIEFYIVVVCVMAIAAAGTAVFAAAAGAALFVASDALLAWNRFVKPAPGGRVLVHVLYHGAQASLVLWLAV